MRSSFHGHRGLTARVGKNSNFGRDISLLYAFSGRYGGLVTSVDLSSVLSRLRQVKSGRPHFQFAVVKAVIIHFKGSLMSKVFMFGSFLLLSASIIAGCGGPDNTATVSPIDDSVVQTPEQMEEMSAQYEADMKSQ